MIGRGRSGERGQPAEQPCLGRVSVNEIGPEPAHQSHELHERPQVAQGPDLAPEVRELAAPRGVAGVELRERGLARPDPAVDQQRLVAVAEARGEEADVVGRPAGVQPGDDPDDPHAGVAAQGAVGVGTRSNASRVRRSPSWRSTFGS